MQASLKSFLLVLAFLTSTAAKADGGSQHAQGAEQRFSNVTEPYLVFDSTADARRAMRAYTTEEFSFDAPKTIDNYEYGAFGEEDGQQIELAGTPFRYTC